MWDPNGISQTFKLIQYHQTLTRPSFPVARIGSAQALGALQVACELFGTAIGTPARARNGPRDAGRHEAQRQAQYDRRRRGSVELARQARRVQQ